MRLRYETNGVDGFIKGIANLVNARTRYFFYRLQTIPKHVDPVQVDAKLITKYRVERSASSRYRDKQAGVARVAYLRCDRDFILLATSGKHLVFQEEPLRDCRRAPIKCFGYRIRHVNDKVEVSVEARTFKALKASMVESVSPLPLEQAELYFRRFPYLPFYRVKRQQFGIWRAVNRERERLGLDPISHMALRLQHDGDKVFRE